MNTRSLALTRVNSKNHTLNKCQSNSVTKTKPASLLTRKIWILPKGEEGLNQKLKYFCSKMFQLGGGLRKLVQRNCILDMSLWA